MGKNFWKSNSFKLGMDLKKGHNKAGMRNLKNTTILWDDGALLSGHQYTALASLVDFAQKECKCTALDTRGEGPIIL